MTIEERIEIIAKQLEEKKEAPKPKDNWDKAQVVFSAFTGIVALFLAFINLYTTKSLTEKARHQTEYFQTNQDKRQTMEETIQEISILPTLLSMEQSSNPTQKKIAAKILDRLKNDTLWKNQFLNDYAQMGKDTLPNINQINKFSSVSNSDTSFWVYLGQNKNNKWQDNFFNIAKIPSLNDIISNNTPIFEHKIKPHLIGTPEDDDWDLGEIIGVLKPKSRVKVLENFTIDDNIYWARVRNVK